MPITKGSTSKCRSCGADIVYSGYGWTHVGGTNRKHVPVPTLADAVIAEDVTAEAMGREYETNKDGKIISATKKKERDIFYCSRRFEFDAAHRVYGHEGKCRTLHGHRYTLEVTLIGEKLENGMVMDFGLIKNIIGTYIDSNFDHNTILYKKDPLVNLLLQDTHSLKKPLVINENPTAENLARILFSCIDSLLFTKEIHIIKVHHVRLYETPNCWSDAYSGPSMEYPKDDNVPTNEELSTTGEVKS